MYDGDQERNFNAGCLDLGLFRAEGGKTLPPKWVTESSGFRPGTVGITLDHIVLTGPRPYSELTSGRLIEWEVFRTPNFETCAIFSLLESLSSTWTYTYVPSL